MRTHTNDYKNEIKTLGREIDAKITFNGTTITSENINSVSLHYEGAILKSVMKQLDLDLNIDIPVETILTAQFGVKVNGTYEYINLGSFVVYKTEKQEDTNSYKLTCYDKMLYAMKDYESLEITYPITIKDYISAICTKLGLTFNDDRFVNYDKTIQNELYLDTNGNSLGYTFRDVLDELAEVTASTICVDDELEIRYIQNIGTYQTTSGSSIHIDEVRDIQDFDIEIVGDTYQYSTTGKNKLGLTNGSYTPSQGTGITASVNNNIVTISGTSSGTNIIDIPLLSTIQASLGTLTKSLKPTGTYTGVQTSLRGSTPSTLVGLHSSDAGNKTGEINADAYYFRIQINTGITVNCTLKAQIETGSTDTDFEPYTAGASPNPSYPQDIEVVTGRQEVSVCGKNLAGNWERKSINSSNQIVNSTTRLMCDYIPLTYNQTYSFKVDNNSYCCHCLYLFDENKNVVNAVSDTSGKTNFTFTTNNVSYKYARVIIRNQNSSTEVTLEEIPTIKPQLEFGNQATTYTPHQEQNYEINLGKNLFDKDNFNELNAYPTSSQISGASATRTFYIPITGGKTYTISKIQSSRFAVATTSSLPAIGVSVIDYIEQNSSTSITIQTSPSSNYLCVFYYISTYDTSITKQEILNTIQVERGNKATTYSPYFTPIELCNINNNKDRIFKTTGKNLYNIQDLVKGRLDNGVIGYESGTTDLTLNTDSFSFTTNANYRGVTSGYIEVKPQTDYVYSQGTQFTGLTFVTACYDKNKTYLGAATYNGIDNYSRKFTMLANTKYFRINIQLTSSGTTTITNPQLEENNQATSYEPYSINEWYIEKKIGKFVLDGTNYRFNSFGYNNRGPILISEAKAVTYSTQVSYLTHFTFKNSVYYDAQDEIGYCSRNNNGGIFIRFGSASEVNTQTKANTWLSNNKPILYSALATPTYTKITNNELIGQLESIQLLEGINNISISSGNLSSPISLSYLASRDTIDEEFLKDVNVNFGEKYGAVNTIALTRAESDTIAQSIPSNLADEDKVTIEIKDNQIMNFEDRGDYLTEILAKLKGLTYYLNDFASTGITYYDLCDKYDVEIDGKLYGCVMFNDEINITQGLEENVYTEMPQQAEVEYRHTTTDDRIAQVQLSVNKQENYIEAIAEDIDGANGIKAQLTSQKAQLEVVSTNIDSNGNVTEVTTTTGFTFNKDGMNISKSETGYNAQHTNEGSYYKDGTSDISTINIQGVMANNFKQRGLHQYSWDGDSYDFSDERVEIDGEYGYATFYNGN